MKKKQVLHKLRRNAPTILTIVAGVGVVVTAVSAVKATPKALELLEDATNNKGEDLTTVEKIKVAGPVYIPSVIFGAATIGCMFGANHLNRQQQAAMTSAYALLDNSYKEYKKKVKEMYGEEADEYVRKELAKDQYADNDIVWDDDTELFYDEFSKRYFESTMKDVIQAEYNLNRQMATCSGAYLNEWYEFLGIPEIPAGKELGWSTGILESHYWAQWIEFDHTRVEMEDGMECTIITMRYEPVIDFAYY
jgi:hypothetical protein